MDHQPGVALEKVSGTSNRPLFCELAIGYPLSWHTSVLCTALSATHTAPTAPSADSH